MMSLSMSYITLFTSCCNIIKYKENMFFIKKNILTFSYMYFIHTTTSLGATIGLHNKYTQ